MVKYLTKISPDTECRICRYHLMYGALTTFLALGLEISFRRWSRLPDVCLALSLDFGPSGAFSGFMVLQPHEPLADVQ